MKLILYVAEREVNIKKEKDLKQKNKKQKEAYIGRAEGCFVGSSLGFSTPSSVPVL